MRDQSHCRTRTGKAGCATAMPRLMTAVNASSAATPELTPRSAAPTAARTRAPSKVRRAPNFEIASDPGIAAVAIMIIGKPDNIPISVADIARSPRSNAITGGTASTDTRNAAPASHNNAAVPTIASRAIC